MTQEKQNDKEDQFEDNTEEDPVINDSNEDDISSRLKELEDELAATKDQMLRAVAEADNARKRAEKSQEDTIKYAVSEFAKNLLDVSDNLRRAIESVPEEEHTSHELLKTLLEGIEATERELLSAFDKAGIQKINPAGEVFNPNFHDVMFETQDPAHPPGTILQVLEPGYVLHDRLLRPARVGVAKGGDKPGKQINEEV